MPFVLSCLLIALLAGGLAAQIPVRTETETFPLEDANKALEALRSGKLSGAAVLVTN